MNLKIKATGTNWEISIPILPSELLEENFGSQIVKVINDFDKTYSRFIENSFTSKISNSKGEFNLPTNAKPLLDVYFKLYKLSDGLFTPLIGKNLIEAGYDKNYSFEVKSLTELPDLIEIVKYDDSTLKVNESVQFDFGAAGKGYLIDLVADFLKSKKILTFTIDAGGDLYYFNSANSKALTVGLEHPVEERKIIGSIDIKDQSLCASSINRRKWKEFNHIIDPKRKKSVKEILSTWVLADSALVADAIATSLFLISPEKLSRYYSFEYLILFSDFSVEKSEGFKSELYYA